MTPVSQDAHGAAEPGYRDAAPEPPREPLLPIVRVLRGTASSMTPNRLRMQAGEITCDLQVRDGTLAKVLKGVPIGCVVKITFEFSRE